MLLFVWYVLENNKGQTILPDNFTLDNPLPNNTSPSAIPTHSIHTLDSIHRGQLPRLNKHLVMVVKGSY